MSTVITKEGEVVSKPRGAMMVGVMIMTEIYAVPELSNYTTALGAYDIKIIHL